MQTLINKDLTKQSQPTQTLICHLFLRLKNHQPQSEKLPNTLQMSWKHFPVNRQPANTLSTLLLFYTPHQNYHGIILMCINDWLITQGNALSDTNSKTITNALAEFITRHNNLRSNLHQTQYCYYIGKNADALSSLINNILQNQLLSENFIAGCRKTNLEPLACLSMPSMQLTRVCIDKLLEEYSEGTTPENNNYLNILMLKKQQNHYASSGDPMIIFLRRLISNHTSSAIPRKIVSLNLTNAEIQCMYCILNDLLDIGLPSTYIAYQNIFSELCGVTYGQLLQQKAFSSNTDNRNAYIVIMTKKCFSESHVLLWQRLCEQNALTLKISKHDDILRITPQLEVCLYTLTTRHSMQRDRSTTTQYIKILTGETTADYNCAAYFYNIIERFLQLVSHITCPAKLSSYTVSQSRGSEYNLYNIYCNLLLRTLSLTHVMPCIQDIIRMLEEQQALLSKNNYYNIIVEVLKCLLPSESSETQDSDNVKQMSVIPNQSTGTQLLNEDCQKSLLCNVLYIPCCKSTGNVETKTIQENASYGVIAYLTNGLECHAYSITEIEIQNTIKHYLQSNKIIIHSEVNLETNIRIIDWLCDYNTKLIWRHLNPCFFSLLFEIPNEASAKILLKITNGLQQSLMTIEHRIQYNQILLGTHYSNIYKLLPRDNTQTNLMCERIEKILTNLLKNIQNNIAHEDIVTFQALLLAKQINHAEGNILYCLANELKTQQISADTRLCAKNNILFRAAMNFLVQHNPIGLLLYLTEDTNLLKLLFYSNTLLLCCGQLQIHARYREAQDFAYYIRLLFANNSLKNLMLSFDLVNRMNMLHLNMSYHKAASTLPNILNKLLYTSPYKNFLPYDLIMKDALSVYDCPSSLSNLSAGIIKLCLQNANGSLCRPIITQFINSYDKLHKSCKQTTVFDTINFDGRLLRAFIILLSSLTKTTTQSQQMVRNVLSRSLKNESLVTRQFCYDAFVYVNKMDCQHMVTLLYTLDSPYYQAFFADYQKHKKQPSATTSHTVNPETYRNESEMLAANALLALASSTENDVDTQTVKPKCKHTNNILLADETDQPKSKIRRTNTHHTSSLPYVRCIIIRRKQASNTTIKIPSTPIQTTAPLSEAGRTNITFAQVAPNKLHLKNSDCTSHPRTTIQSLLSDVSKITSLDETNTTPQNSEAIYTATPLYDQIAQENNVFTK